MAADPIERKMLDKVLDKLGFSVDDFDLELVSVNDILQPDKSYVDIKQYKVTRKSTGKFHTYTTGHGSVWPDDVEAHLKAGKFGPP